MNNKTGFKSSHSTFSPSSSHRRRAWTEKIERFPVRFNHLSDANKLPVFDAHFLLSAFSEACHEMAQENVCPLQDTQKGNSVRKYTRIHWQNALIYYWGKTGRWPSNDTLLHAMLAVEDYVRDIPWAKTGVKRERERMYEKYKIFRTRVEADRNNRKIPEKGPARLISPLGKTESAPVVQGLFKTIQTDVQARIIKVLCEHKTSAAPKARKSLL